MAGRGFGTAFFHGLPLKSRDFTRPQPRKRGNTRRSPCFRPDSRSEMYIRADAAVILRWNPGPSGSAQRGSFRLSPESQTSRRFRRILRPARCGPCPDTCRYIRGSHRRSRHPGCCASYQSAFRWRDLPFPRDICQRQSKISPPGRSKTSPLNVMRYAVLGGSCGPTGSTIAPAVKQVFLGISAVFGFG